MVWSIIEEFLADPEALVRKVIAADKKLSGEVSDLDAAEQKLSAEVQSIEDEVADVWKQQKARGWPLAWVADQLDQLNARRRVLTAQLDEVRQKRSAAMLDRDQSTAVAG
jgi:hypothetical protein